MDYQTHLYLTLYPMEALVGSHLEPKEFARHFNSGSSKFYSGKLIFVELDPSYRNPYFHLDERIKDLKPHEDGRPKATKYFSNYRALEHVDCQAMGKLWIATPEGYVLPLEAQEHTAPHSGDQVRIYWEIAPVSMVVLSSLDYLKFGQFITDPEKPIAVPRTVYTQIDMDIPEFLEDFEENPLRQPPIPDIHPSVLRDGIMELQRKKTKYTKGLSLSAPLGKLSFKSLRHGFMFAAPGGRDRFYPLPPLEEIEARYFKFWKFM